jgi:predicted ATPase
MAVLVEAWDRARQGNGGVVEVVGEPGIGKSRLVDELKAHAHGSRILFATADPYESSTPYFVWRNVLREALGIPLDAEPRVALEHLTRRLTELAPALLPWLPLLAVPVDAPAEATRATLELDEQFRKGRLEDVTAELLAVALPTPTLMIFDDVHLLDEPSADLLQRLVVDVSSRPHLVLVTRRDHESGFVPRPGPALTTLRPAPLAEQESLALMAGAGQEALLRPDEIASLVKRASGNPLFLRELMAAATSAGSVDELPDSVQGVISSQIDRLSPRDRTVLRYASVLGVAFTETLLREMVAGESIGPGRALFQRLGAFLVPEPAHAFRFRHALIRDAAYDGLPYRRRRQLHSRAGDAIERSAKDPDEQAELLSMHNFHAAAFSKAWPFSVIARRRKGFTFGRWSLRGRLGPSPEQRWLRSPRRWGTCVRSWVTTRAQSRRMRRREGWSRKTRLGRPW